MSRVVDVVVAAIGAIVLAPVLAGLAALVRSRLGRPVLFTHERAGRHGVPFTLNKFRTMSDERSPDGSLLPDEARLGPFGRWLRRTSLDELPELGNVLRGDMALVGPRPLPVSYLDRYTATEARRHRVRPGITGWAQVNGRNATSWEERLAMDAWYVEHRSWRLDLRILARTVTTVLRGTGISAADHATMTELRPPPER